MIKTFACAETEKVWNGKVSIKLPNNIQTVALRKLRMVAAAVKIEDLRIPPNSRLEKLGGDRAGTWSIRINQQWRVCFQWNEGHAFEVEIVDYH